MQTYRCKRFPVLYGRLAFWFLLTVAVATECRAAGSQVSQVFPLRIPAGSPETFVHIFGFNLAEIQAVKVNGLSVPFTRVGKVQLDAMISSEMLTRPTRLKMQLETSSGANPAEPIDIEIFSREHRADLTIEVSKNTLTPDERFTLILTVTNRSPYPLYFGRQIEPFVDGGPASVYSLEVRPLLSKFFYVPKKVSVTGGSFLARTVEEYVAAGLLVRLEPDQSYTKSLDLTATDLIAGMGSNTISPGTYIVRALYSGMEMPLKTAQTYVLNEQLYSNELELIISK